jgi:predicted naringenin-chalcone synthase
MQNPSRICRAKNPCPGRQSISPEQLVVQSLFADGHIRYTMTIAGEAQAAINKLGFEILAVREETVPDSLSDMTWVLSDFGFRMTLSCEVPKRVAASLPSFLARSFRQSHAR